MNAKSGAVRRVGWREKKKAKNPETSLKSVPFTPDPVHGLGINEVPSLVSSFVLSLGGGAVSKGKSMSAHGL